MRMDVHPFAGGRKAPITQKHRALIWENMLGTVYGRNPLGEVRYFDFNWDQARAFAEIENHQDLRVARNKVRYTSGYDMPRLNQFVLYGVLAAKRLDRMRPAA